MNPNPFFTIVTASFNNAGSIGGTLASVGGQSFKDLEHIVIDGQSTDNTTAILKSHQGQYQLTWISEPDAGISDALNKAVTAAKGVYLLVLQADDRLISNDILEKVHAAISDQRHDICAFPVVVEYADGPLVRRPTARSWIYRFKLPFPHQGAFIHRRLHEKIGLYDKRYRIGMDYAFFYKALAAGATSETFSFPVAAMSPDGIGTIRQHMRERILEEFAIQQAHESGPLWSIVHRLYQPAYFLYKIKFNLSADPSIR